MRKALGDCRGCGNCNIGCAFDAKRSALATYVPWAEQHGARVLAETEVDRIETRGRRAVAVHVRAGRSREPQRIVAKQVVVAAGAINSSALLLKSGLRRNVGTRVSFNAGSMMVAEFDDPLDGYDADQMTWFLPGDGFIIEPTHNPLMSAALTTPGWLDEHAALMRRQRHLAYAGSLISTGPTGTVVQSPFWGHEETRFSPGPADVDKVKRGLKLISEIFFAAGARRLILPTHRFRAIRSPKEVAEIDEHVVSTRRFSFGSAHPQGGNADVGESARGRRRRELRGARARQPLRLRREHLSELGHGQPHLDDHGDRQTMRRRGSWLAREPRTARRIPLSARRGPRPPGGGSRPGGPMGSGPARRGARAKGDARRPGRPRAQYRVRAGARLRGHSRLRGLRTPRSGRRLRLVFAYIDRMRAGERNVLVPEFVRYFGNSSGSSNPGKPKFLPITERQIGSSGARAQTR